jgi:hypothetical protein
MDSIRKELKGDKDNYNVLCKVAKKQEYVDSHIQKHMISLIVDVIGVRDTNDFGAYVVIYMLMVNPCF